MNHRGDKHEPDRQDAGEPAFSREERAALAAWQAPTPPPGFADAVLAAWQAQAPAQAQAQTPRRPAVQPPHPIRGLAFAAVALLLIGGFFSMRSLIGGVDTVGDPAAGFTAQDGGPAPEVRAAQPEGGIERQPS